MMFYYYSSDNDWWDYLEHHGVLGQKWGVRRYQNADGSYTAAGKRKYGIGTESKNANVRRAARSEEAAKKQRLKKRLDKIEDIASVSFDLNGNRVHWDLSNPNLKRAYTDIVKSDFEKSSKSKLFNEKNDRYALSEDDLKSINTMFNSGDYSYKINCQRCAVALELKKRGIDVTAGKNTGNFQNAKNYLAYMGESSAFNNARPMPISGGAAAVGPYFKENMSPGMSGTISYSYVGDDGKIINSHIQNFTVLEDGTVRFEDGQNGTVMTVEEFEKKFGNRLANIDVTRLDNLTPNYKNIEMSGVSAGNQGKSGLPSRNQRIQEDRNSRIGSSQKITTYGIDNQKTDAVDTYNRYAGKTKTSSKKKKVVVTSSSKEKKKKTTSTTTKKRTGHSGGF